MANRPEILAELLGRVPFLYHPRIFDHPGPVLNFGAHGWHYVEPFVGKKNIIGIDPCPVTKPPEGCTLLRRAVAPFDGIIEIKGGIPQVRAGAQGMAWYESGDELAYLAKAIRMKDLVERYGHDWAGLKINIEGTELLELIMLKEPIADQMTVAFHDRSRTGGDVFLPTARDGVMHHLDNWYDWVQVEPKNDWWFFLRRDPADWNPNRTRGYAGVEPQ